MRPRGERLVDQALGLPGVALALGLGCADADSSSTVGDSDEGAASETQGDGDPGDGDPGDGDPDPGDGDGDPGDGDGDGDPGDGDAEPFLDAAVDWGNGKVYFFRGAEYVRFDRAQTLADPGYPKDIAGMWPGLWPEGIDAATIDGQGKAHFFRGAQTIRYDIAGDAADPGYPRPIVETWPGLWTTDIDAALYEDAQSSIWFFRDSEYLRWDLEVGAVTPGYPRTIEAEFPGAWPIVEVDAALGGAPVWSLFDGRSFLAWDTLGDQHQPLRGVDCVWPNLWNPHYGTGEPGDNLSPQLAALLEEMPSAQELAKRKQRVLESITDETDLTPLYPQFSSSVEAFLGAWGCLLLETVSGAHRFRCATHSEGVQVLELPPMSVTSINWREAMHHVDQVSQGDFMADWGTPLSIFEADDEVFFIESVTGNPPVGSINAGLNVRVRFAVDGADVQIGFSHLNVAVPQYVLDAELLGTPLATGTVFGFIGYTGNLWIGAPPALDMSYSGSGAGLPVAHSHLWFVDDPDNHAALTPWARRALCYFDPYPYGGG